MDRDALTGLEIDIVDTDLLLQVLGMLLEMTVPVLSSCQSVRCSLEDREREHLAALITDQNAAVVAHTTLLEQLRHSAPAGCGVEGGGEARRTAGARLERSALYGRAATPLGSHKVVSKS